MPEALTRRMVESICSDNPEEREFGIIFLWQYLLPIMDSPQPGLPNFSSKEFALAKAFSQNEAGFARLAREDSRAARESFVGVADFFLCSRVWRRPIRVFAPGESVEIREAIALMALRDPDVDVRIEAIRSLDNFEGTPETLVLLRRLSGEDNPRIRLAAACALALGKDPQGFRDLVNLVTNASVQCGPMDKIIAVSRIKGRYPSLEPLCSETHAALRGSPEELTTVTAKWKAWLERTEFERLGSEQEDPQNP